jgi:Glycosyltransferase family 87
LVVAIAGLVARIYLALFTTGTYDVEIWREHVAGIRQHGLIGYYHAQPEMNHPPFISLVITGFAWFAQISGIPFRVILRLPVVFADAGIALVLLRLIKGNARFVTATLYWLNPLAIIFSGYHGNTDLLMAFFVVAAVWFLAERRILWAAVALGFSFGIKLPGLLVVPALVFFIPNWRERFWFGGIAALTAVSTYLPAVFADPVVVWHNVVAYRGQLIHTTGGIPVWGSRVFLDSFNHRSFGWRGALSQLISFYQSHNVVFCLGLILLWCGLRRSKRTVPELALTITGIYAILYGFSDYWSFQYFAWSVPFWCLAHTGFAAAATLLAGGYIWALYAYLCGSPWLLGQWDFLGHPYWPASILVLRNAALLFFMVSATALLAGAIYFEGVGLIKLQTPSSKHQGNSKDQ